MKPKKLTLKNFGPYLNESVDFDDFQEAGLFLISGKTGAGKTTLFDGMTYALFGETSGQQRSGKEMRSMFATPEEETRVTFSFEHQDRLYEISRAPEQQIKKLRGEGTRTQTMKVSLTIFDSQGQEQTQFTKKGEVDQFIKDLLHIDAKQFFQIVLLPQGEFRNFLIASSNEKEKLLRHLFGTEMYQRLNDWLRTKQKELTDVLSQKQHQIEALMQQFQWEAEAKEYVTLTETLADWQVELESLDHQQQILQEQLQQATIQAKKALDALYLGKEQVKQYEEYQKLLARQALLDEQAAERAVQETQLQRLKWLQAQTETLNNLEQVRHDLVHAQAEWAAKKEALATTQAAIETWQAQESVIVDYRQQQQVAIQQIQQLNAQLPQALAVQSLEEEQADITQHLAELATALGTFEQQIQANQEQEQHYIAQLAVQEQVQQTELRLVQMENQVAHYQESQTTLATLGQKQAMLEVQIQQEQVMLADQTTALQRLEEQVADCEHNYAKMQIARLQLLLKDGEPCPVCGSTEHVKGEHQVYTTEEVTQSEVALAQAEQALKEANERYQQQLSAIRYSQQQLAEIVAQVEQTTASVADWYQRCVEGLALVQGVDIQQQFLAQQQALQEAKTTVEQAEQSLAAVHQQRQAIEVQQADWLAKQQQEQTHYQELTTKINVLTEQLQGQTQASLQLKLADSQAQEQTLTQKIQAYEEQGKVLVLEQTRLASETKAWHTQVSQLTDKQTALEQTLQMAIAASEYQLTEVELRASVPETHTVAHREQQLTEYRQEQRFVAVNFQQSFACAQLLVLGLQYSA